MKNRLFILFISVVFSLGLSAQTNIKVQLENKMHDAENLYENRNYDSALKVFLSIIEQTSKTEGSKDLNIDSRINAACCYKEIGDYDSGINILKSIIESELSDVQKKKTYEIFSANSLLHAEKLLGKGDKLLTEAETVLKTAMPYAEGENLQKMKVCLQKIYLAESQQSVKQLNHKGAVELLNKARTISDDDAVQMEIAFNLARIYESAGDYEKMLDNYQRCRILASKLGKDRYVYSSLIGERTVYKMQNNMEDYTRLGVTLDSLTSVSDEPNILSEYYDYIGNEFVDLGNYSIAESYFRRYEKLIDNEKDITKRFNYKLMYFSNMRDLKRKQNDYKSAIDFNQQLAELYKLIFNNKNYMYYISYMVDTQLYAETGDSLNFERTCDSLLTSLPIMPDAFNKSLVYNFRGVGYSKFGNSEKAISNYHMSDSILAEEYPETYDMRMVLLKLRAGEYKKMGSYDKACTDYKKYMELTAKVYGTKSEQYSEAVYMYANAQRANNNLAYSVELYRKSIEIMNNILRKQLRYVNATDRTSYINTLSKRMWLMSSFALNYSSVDRLFVKDCYNTILVLKSLLFESDRSMYNTLQTKGTPEDVADFVELSRLRARHRSLYRNYDENKEEIDANFIKMRELDNKLTEKSKAYTDYTSFLDFRYEDVCKMLGKKDVLFDFFDYDYNGEHMYVAYVVKRNNENPIILEMFTESQLDSLLDGASVDALYTESKSETAVNLLWKRLEKYADKGANVYYVPSGLLYQLSIESLPLSDGSLLGEKYSFVRLSSAREIKNTRKRLEGDRKAVLYGGLHYDVNVADMKEQSVKYNDRHLYVMRNIAQGANKFNYLPETLNETEAISEILSSNGYDVTMYSKDEGTEESFLSMHNNSPQILHIATHGFYYTPQEASQSILLKGSTDAMFLSGLVLSGGNAAWQGKELPSGVLGGIVSAGNISCLDLSNTGLTVLSACQSGAGKVTRQGLFGLQRAFKKAGVQTMVMTLWNVSDVVTREFMVEFYKNLFSGHKGYANKTKAFMKAKKKIRSKYPEPLYWAGFVMVD